jgi:hypothetical protein
MRIFSLGLLVLGALFIGAAAPVRAQSLADVAKKEQERRRTTKTAGKVYTNNDLAPLSGSGNTAAPGGSAAAGDAKDAAGGDAQDKTEAQDAGKSDSKTEDNASGDAHDRSYWTKRMGGLRESLQRDQVYADALQSRINALTTDFVNRDDPAQRAQIGTQREAAVNELARLKKQIEDEKKAIADTEEEARRSGVPAGWLR